MFGVSIAPLAVALTVAQAAPPAPQTRPLTIVGAPQAGGPTRDESQRRPPLIGTGSLSGSVVNERGQAIKGARVSLGGGQVGRSTLTDASGAFVFEKLPEGRYGISASRTRYLSGSYGQKRSDRSGTTIQLADGEQKHDLTVVLFLPAVITGTVYGDDGEPVQNAQVRALRYSMRTGVRRLQSSNNASTDDRGVYRLYGLPPGEYVISANASNQDNFTGPLMTAEMAAAMERAAAAAAAAGDSFSITRMSNGAMTLSNGQTIESPAPVAFAPTYYPGSTSPVGAMSVSVQGGEERVGIDVTLMKVQTATVSGMVVAATGVPPQNVTVTLQPADEAAQGIPLSSSRGTADGRFTLRNVPPGQYNVIARSTNTVRVEVPVSATPGGNRVQTVSTSQTVSTGRTLISVDGASLSGVIVTLDGGHSVSGRVVFDGGMPPDLSRTRMTASVQNAPGSTSVGPSPPPAVVGPDGAFTISNVPPGRYTLRVNGVQGFSMKSSIVHGQDTLDFPFEVDNNDIGDGLVTMSAGLVSSELSGTITDQLSQPAIDYTIVVFSSDQRFWTPGSRRIATARPSTDGQYSVRGLPAGDYQIAALSDLEPGTQYDPEFLKALLVASTRVTIAAGGKATQDLRINISR